MHLEGEHLKKRFAVQVFINTRWFYLEVLRHVFGINATTNVSKKYGCNEQLADRSLSITQASFVTTAWPV